MRFTNSDVAGIILLDISRHIYIGNMSISGNIHHKHLFQTYGNIYWRIFWIFADACKAITLRM